MSTNSIAGFLSDLKFFAIILVVALIFRTTAFGMYHIPSESMLPTLAVGDRIAVSKFAYGYSRHSLPFSVAPDFATETGRIFSKTPERGDIIVFKHPRTKENYIKRVVGLPGETIELRDGRLYINGELTHRETIQDLRYREHRGRVVDVRAFQEALVQVPGKAKPHAIYERSDRYGTDNFKPTIVPDGHLFVLGDNRDNSLDSRFFERGVGFLPMDHVVGKAIALPFSFHQCRQETGLNCLDRPWFSALQ